MYMYVSGGVGGEVHTVVIWLMLVGSVGGGFIDIATELNNGAPFPGDQSITQRALSGLTGLLPFVKTVTHHHVSRKQAESSDRHQQNQPRVQKRRQHLVPNRRGTRGQRVDLLILVHHLG